MSDFGPIPDVEARFIELTTDTYDDIPTWFFQGVIDADAEDDDRATLGNWLKSELRAHFVHVRKIAGSAAEIMAHFR